ncbi:MAG TPA: FUSC family protein [Candidatus Acidoferrales bacterium]|jgi:multidrug resistance protein MdtO|nr:FUSC family protein [Candidatus Acidoferrales bacterium]
MATVAQSPHESPGVVAWFWEFLKVELAPYPGRAGIVARMVLAATLAMIICMTFRIPYGFQAAIFALLISRENLRATLQSAGTLLLYTGLGTAYVLVSARFVINVPILHFLWIIGSFFLAFYLLSTMTNYGASTTFIIVIAIGVPLWDRHLSAETNVEDTLRLTLATSVGVLITAAVEWALARVRPGDDIILPVAERLAAVESLLVCYIEDRPVDQATEKKITRMGMLGTSTLRRVLRHSDYSKEYTAQMSGVVALVGRLVDIAASLTQLSLQPSSSDQNQLRNLAMTLASIRTDLIKRRIPVSVEFSPNYKHSRRVPLLCEMENVVTLIPQALTGSRSMEEYFLLSDDTPRLKIVVPDALVNPEHFKFAVKGCVAASVSYIIYNSIAWPGISTAVTTCLLTALSTIGVSRQKQMLRFSGALIGGFVIGIGSQIFILPNLDSIAGFTVLFILVTALSSWFMTCSPRLSYFGLQVALAFYLINVQEFAVQTSLSVARDRVVGILLGLFIMWLVFDQLWGSPSAVEMERIFISNLRLLAQLVREPLPGTERTWRSYSLRETINGNFDSVRSLADGVLFDLRSSRQQDLALRSRIRQWQPPLQTFLVTRLLLLKFRLQLPGFELPPAVRAAQREFDNHLATRLDGMADRLEGKASEGKDDFEHAFEGLEKTVRSCCSNGPQGLLAPELQAFLALSRSINNVTSSLHNEI